MAVGDNTLPYFTLFPNRRHEQLAPSCSVQLHGNVIMRICILASLVLLVNLASFVRSARRIDANVRARDTLQRRRNAAVTGKRDVEEEGLRPEELLQLTSGEEMEEVVESQDALGNTVERLQETYLGVPVLDGVVTVKKNQGGQLTGDATGTLIQSIDEDLPDMTAELTVEEAITLALEAESDNEIRDEIGDISVNDVIILDEKDTAKLVYKVSYLIDGVKRPVVFIDAKTGKILRLYDALNTYPCRNKVYNAVGGNVKMGKIDYGRVPYCLDPIQKGDTCFLENKHVRVVDMKNETFENLTDTASFPCHEGCNDHINGAYSPAVDAFFFGTLVGQMFEDWFGRPPLKDKMVLRVHYSDMMSNAFWNGENSTFGDGGSDFYPLVSIDVVAHEIAHGITEQSSNLMYFGESGGMNEAFSDILGDTAERYMYENDLMVGHYIMKNRDYLREFEMPEKDNMSISQVSAMNDSIDPHYSSGVFRRVWYVLVELESVPVKDAAAVFLHANRFYWHYMGTFLDCSCGLLKAVVDLGYDTGPYAVAFTDVGLEACNLSTHIFSLSNNISQNGISVSEDIRPVFKFTTPVWAERLLIIAASNSTTNASIHIDVSEVTAANTFTNESLVIADGAGSLVLDEFPETVTIQLSTTDWHTYHDVSLTAGYVCSDTYNSTDFMDNIFYEWYCDKSTT